MLLVPCAGEASELQRRERQARGPVPTPVGLAIRQKENQAELVGLGRTSTLGLQPAAGLLAPAG